MGKCVAKLNRDCGLLSCKRIQVSFGTLDSFSDVLSRDLAIEILN